MADSPKANQGSRHSKASTYLYSDSESTRKSALSRSTSSSVASTPTRASRRLRRLSPELDPTGSSSHPTRTHHSVSSVESKFQFEDEHPRTADVDDPADASDSQSSTRSFLFHQADNPIASDSQSSTRSFLFHQADNLIDSMPSNNARSLGQDTTDFEFDQAEPTYPYNSPHHSFEFARPPESQQPLMSGGSVSENPSSFNFVREDNRDASSDSVRSFLFGSVVSSSAGSRWTSPDHPNGDIGDMSVASSGFRFEPATVPINGDEGHDEDDGETDNEAEGEEDDEDMDDDDSEDDDLLRDPDAIASIFSADNSSRIPQEPQAPSVAYSPASVPPLLRAHSNSPAAGSETGPPSRPSQRATQPLKSPAAGPPRRSSHRAAQPSTFAMEEDVIMNDVCSRTTAEPLASKTVSPIVEPRPLYHARTTGKGLLNRKPPQALSQAGKARLVVPKDHVVTTPLPAAIKGPQTKSMTSPNIPSIETTDVMRYLPQGTKAGNRPSLQPLPHEAHTVPPLTIADTPSDARHRQHATPRPYQKSSAPTRQHATPPPPRQQSPAPVPVPAPRNPPPPPSSSPSSKDKLLEGLLKDMSLLRIENEKLENARAELQRRIDAKTYISPVQPTPPPPSWAKPPSTAAKPPSTTLSKAQITILKADVRCFARSLLKLPNQKLLQPTTAEVKQFKAHQRGGPTAEYFRLDFVGSRGSSWNQEAFKVFRDAFLRSPNHRHYVNLNEGPMILYRFKCHFIDTLKPLYKKENPSESPADLSAKELRKHQRSARDSRRNRLFDRRWKTTLGHPGLQQYVPLIEALGREGMSEDESGPETEHVARSEVPDRVNSDGQKQYAILRYAWRNDPVIIPILRTIDLITLSRKFGSTGRPERGNWTHVRLPTARVSTRTTIQRRPTNTYLPSFLETLTDHQKEDLKMLDPVPVPSISSELKAEASRFKHVKGRPI